MISNILLCVTTTITQFLPPLEGLSSLFRPSSKIAENERSTAIVAENEKVDVPKLTQQLKEMI